MGSFTCLGKIYDMQFYYDGGLPICLPYLGDFSSSLIDITNFCKHIPYFDFVMAYYFFSKHNMFSRCIVVSMQYTTSGTWARNVLKYYNQVKLHCIFKLGWFWLYVALPKSTQRHVRSVVKKFKEEHFGRSHNLKLWHTKYPM